MDGVISELQRESLVTCALTGTRPMNKITLRPPAAVLTIHAAITGFIVRPSQKYIYGGFCPVTGGRVLLCTPRKVTIATGADEFITDF
jgi:hypothetical protein